MYEIVIEDNVGYYYNIYPINLYELEIYVNYFNKYDIRFWVWSRNFDIRLKSSFPYPDIVFSYTDINNIKNVYNLVSS